MTKIEWTDESWNPVTGCDRVSDGCTNCYALTMAKRLKAMGVAGYQHDGDPRTSGPGFAVTLQPDKLALPLRWSKPKMIFVNSMSDLFHKDVPDEYVAKVFAVMALAHTHTFQLLTKRHGRMRSMLSQSPGGPSGSFVQRVKRHMWMIAGQSKEAMAGWHHRVDQKHEWWPLDNVWLGVSVENQEWANIRVPALLETPAAVRFLSCEPLLGPITFRWAPWAPLRDASHLDSLQGIDWIIAGGESGRGARPMHPQWVRDLRDQCAAAGVAFHFKQFGAWTPIVTPNDSWYDREPDAWVCKRTGAVRTEDEALADVGGSYAGVYKVGKKAAGRELDGRTHDDYPEVEHA